MTGTFNNLGIPGATSFHLLAPGYGSLAGVAQGLANPYYARISSSETSTVLEDAIAQSPTFFTLWIGNNDILGYAASGGSGVDQSGNLDPSTYAGNDISDPNVVAGSIQTILTSLAQAGATQGAIANIPDVTATPFFTTVPHNVIPLDQATADLVNGAYAAYNGALAAFSTNANPLGFPLITPEEAAKRTITFSAGDSNPVVIIDEDLTDLTAVDPALINMSRLPLKIY